MLIPIAAVGGADGRVLVRMGQRRTLAARQAGLANVPVYVRTASPDACAPHPSMPSPLVDRQPDQRAIVFEDVRRAQLLQPFDEFVE